MRIINKKNNKLALVFLSGLGVDPIIGKRFLSNISPTARLIFPCYPKVEQLYSKNMSIVEKLLFIARYIDRQLPSHAVLIGWSFGGIIAKIIHYKNTKKNLRLITIASTPKFVSYENWPGISDRKSTRLNSSHRL